MLPVINCPRCKIPMKFDSSKIIKTTSKYEDCVRYCPRCNCKASNSQSKATFIYANYIDNLPEVFRDDDEKLKSIFDKALNERNRKEKIEKFAFSTSEDAFTWIFFSSFIKKSELNVLAKAFGINTKIEDILFWGVPYLNSEIGNKLRDTLIQKQNDRAENPVSRTEPDIIIVTDNSIIFIEVKVKSGMPKDDITKYTPYLDNNYYSDTSKVKHENLYELIRNWTFINDLSISFNKDFKLINLMPKKTIDKEHKIQKIFISSLKNKGHYEVESWESVFGSLKKSSYNTELFEERLKSIK